MKKYDIITVGSAVVDFFLYTKLNERKGDLCLPVGSKLLVEDFKMATGGGGTNTAVAFSKIGLKAGFIGKVGTDLHGEIILDELKKEGVDFLGEKGEETTGTSIILDSAQKGRTVLLHKGANNFLYFNEIDLKNLKTKWFYLSSLIGESLQSEIKIAEWAKKNGVKVAYNISSYLARMGVGKIKKLLTFVDIFILNEEEARELIPRGDFFSGLRELGPKIVCVTYGKKGSECFNGFEIYKAVPGKVKAVETTGAGDAFASGFVSGIILNQDIPTAMKFGSVNAASVIQQTGAKNGLLNRKEIEKRSKGDLVRISVKSY